MSFPSFPSSRWTRDPEPTSTTSTLTREGDRHVGDDRPVAVRTEHETDHPGLDRPPSDDDAPAAGPPVGIDGGVGAPGGDGTTPTGAGRRLRMERHGPLVALSAALLVLVSIAVVVGFRERGATPVPDSSVDAWAPYWALDQSAGELPLRAGALREVSPYWFQVTAVDELRAHPDLDADLAESFLRDARRAEVPLVPSVTDALAPGRMASILGDPVLRRRHVQTIVAFAADMDAEGIDLHYDGFAVADGRETWADTRPDWVAFVEQLADELHADGRTLTVTVPPVYDARRTAESGFWVYDHGAIVEHVDRIRVMAYDYSVDEPGPIAPLPWVEQAVTGVIEATGRPERLVLGLPAYGRNWPVDIVGECPADVEVPGRTSVTPRTIDELVEQRDAVPVRDGDTAEWSFDYSLEISDGTTTCIQDRVVHYVDADGIRARMDLARRHGLDGVSLWALGFEDDAVWDSILSPASDEPGADEQPTGTTAS